MSAWLHQILNKIEEILLFFFFRCRDESIMDLYYQLSE